MSAITRITGSAWPTSGTATTSSTGFNAVAGLTHVGSTGVPPGSAATGFLRGADNAAASFRLDATTSVTPNAGDTYWLRFWVRFAKTSSALPADGTNLTFNFIGAVGSARLYVGLGGLSHTRCLKTLCRYGSTGLSDSIVSGANLTWSGNAIPMDKWVQFGIQIMRHSTDGAVRIFLNGSLVCSSFGFDTNTSADTNLTVTMPATSGIRYEVSGPVDSYNDPHADVLSGSASLLFTIRPLYELYERDGSEVLRSFPCMTPNQVGGSWTSAADLAGVSRVAWGAGGFLPLRGVFSLTGGYIESIDGIGDTFTNGWLTTRFEHILIPSGSLKIRFKDTSGTEIIAIDAGSGYLSVNGQNLAAIAADQRYALYVHFGQSGQIHYTLKSLTANYSSSTHIWSGDTGVLWTPREIGKIRIESTYGSSAILFGGVQVAKWFTCIGPDSYSAAASPGFNVASPAYIGGNHISGNLIGENAQTLGGLNIEPHAALIPGGAYPGSLVGAYQAPQCCYTLWGRSGHLVGQFVANVLPNMAYSHNIRLMFWPSVNDLTSSLTDATRDAKVTQVSGYFETLASTLIAGGNAFWIVTAPRLEGTAYTEQCLQAINLINDSLVHLASKYQSSDGRVWLSRAGNYVGDHATLYSGGDGTHMTVAGDGRYAAEILRSRVVPVNEISDAVAEQLATDRAELQANEEYISVDTPLLGITVGNAVLTAQDVADAMALATAATPATGSPLKLIQDTKTAAEAAQEAAEAISTGTGAYQVNLTVKDGGGNLISSARVTFTKGAESYSATTQANGVASFNVDGGNWAIAVYKSGYTYVGGTVSVSDNVSQDVTITANVVPDPSDDPGACTIYDTTYDTDNSIKSGVVYTHKVLTADVGTMRGNEKTATSVGTSPNNISFTVQRGCQISVKRGLGDYVGPLTVPDAASASLKSMLEAINRSAIIGEDA